jgi:hypothetical protein
MTEATELDHIEDPTFRKLCERAVEAMQAHQVPGVALGVIHDGQAHTAGFGVTSIEHPLAVTADTLFQIGSIFSVEAPDLVMEVTYKGGFPRQDSPPMPSPPPARVALGDEDRAIVTEGPMEKAYGEFLRDTDGKIQWLRAGGRLYARLTE